jgi:hypothetical protein
MFNRCFLSNETLIVNSEPYSHISGSGKLYDGEEFLVDCTYELEVSQESRAHTTVHQSVRHPSVYHIQGRIKPTAPAPIGVPLVLHLNRNHRLRVVAQPQGDVVALGCFFVES